MTRTAALWAGWDRRAPRSLAGPLAPSRGASRPGVPFLPGALGPDARLIVEIAWGADLTASSDSWSWRDITTDVHWGGGDVISITVGAADEASTTQPATCGFRVDNESGAYSLGRESANWPHVRRNTPVRVRVDLGAGPWVLFSGYADGLTPSWGAGGRHAMVTVRASGILRRLLQRSSPVLSAIRRSTSAATSVVAYWPCEDERGATSIASAITGGSPLGFYLGGPDFTASSDFACSAPLPVVRGSAWYGPIAPYVDTGVTRVRALASFPAAGSPTATIVRVHTTGTADLWELRYGTNGALRIRAWAQGLVLFEQGVAFAVDGRAALIGLRMDQAGANVDWTIEVIFVGTRTTQFTAGVLNARTVGVAYKIETNVEDAHQDLALGHLIVRNAAIPALEQINALEAHSPESPGVRFGRLCAENGVPFSYEVAADGAPGPDSVFSGAQSIATLITLLREAEAVEQGIIHDGLSDGLTLITRRWRENRDPFLVLDVASGDIPDPFTAATDDDSRNLNRVTASRSGGSSYTHEDTDGPLGTAAVGVYDGAVTLNTHSDSELPHYAGLLVRAGTVGGYRYPRLQLDFTHRSELLGQWLNARLGGRIDVVGIDTALTQHPAGTISLALAGYTQEIDQSSWRVAANCAPYEPWQVGLIAADVGDQHPLLLRADTDGSSLVEPVAAGATTLTVATPSGPPWTTDADDFPLSIDLDGITVRVTAISGASSPQTFTVDPATLTRQRPAGSPISVITPRLAL